MTKKQATVCTAEKLRSNKPDTTVRDAALKTARAEYVTEHYQSKSASEIMASQNQTTRPERKMRPLGEMRYVAMGPQSFTLEQAWAPIYGGQIEWRQVPIISRKEAGYGE